MGDPRKNGAGKADHGSNASVPEAIVNYVNCHVWTALCWQGFS
jgi:hypothetical protein